MSAFRFRLQPALDAALAHERATAHAARSARAAVRGLERTLHAAEALARDALTRPGHAAEFDLAHARALRLRTLGALARAQAAAREATARFEASRNRRRALERLRDVRLAAHRATLALRDAAELDEANALVRRIARSGL